MIYEYVLGLRGFYNLHYSDSSLLLAAGYRYDQSAGGITYGVSTSNPTSFGATSTIHSCPLPASFSSSPLLCSLPSGSSSAQDHTQATPSTIPFVNTTSSPTGILPVLNVPNIQLFPLPQLVAPTFQLTNAVAGQGISFVHGITPQSYTLGMPIAPAFGQLVFTSLPLQYPGHVTGSGQSIVSIPEFYHGYIRHILYVGPSTSMLGSE